MTNRLYFTTFDNPSAICPRRIDGSPSLASIVAKLPAGYAVGVFTDRIAWASRPDGTAAFAIVETDGKPTTEASLADRRRVEAAWPLTDTQRATIAARSAQASAMWGAWTERVAASQVGA